ncbi:MAG: SWIM zinc finger family protein [Cyanobacteria bacterium J06560_2]
MSPAWTLEQVLALSPDASSTKRGKALAQPAKWPLLGQSERALWGECQGSGRKPYRTIIDLGTARSVEPAFRCSCPSRKFPCKHALGLFLLRVQQVPFSQGEPPDWGAEWLTKRDQDATQKQQSQQQTGISSVDSEKQAQQAQQRLEKRAEKVTDGLVDLDQWLQDILRRGLADLPAQPYSFWDQAAARLIDAQAPGLARRVKALASIPHSGRGWPERMMQALGSLYLLVQGYGQRSQLDPMMQAEVLKQIGFPQKKEDLQRRAEAADPLVLSITDTWQVMGRVVTEEDSLKTQRVWLWGKQSEKAALVLSFAHGHRQPLDMSLVPGDCFDGQLLFYPGTGVQRALVVEKRTREKTSHSGMGFQNIKTGIEAYTQALSTNPWMIQFPTIFTQTVLRCCEQTWFLQDSKNQLLPVTSEFDQGWEVLAMSGGRPLSIFGEWNGQTLLPLSVWSEKTFIALEAT